MLELLETIPYKGIRRIIGKRMELSGSIPQSYQGLYVDVTELMALRSELIKTGNHEKLSFNDFVVRATVLALQKTPMANSAFLDGKIEVYKNINIGIIASTARGIIAPVVKNCQDKSIYQLSAEIKALHAKAMDGTILPDDYAEGTFSITNIGTLNADDAVPLLYPPQAALLGVCSARRMPVVRTVDGEEQIVIRTMCKFIIDADHRVLDGPPMARLLNDIRMGLENPQTLVAME